MSLILDALRKLDRERASQQRGANIASEILRPDLPRPVKRIPLSAATLIVTAAAAAAITYGVLKSGFPFSRSSLGFQSGGMNPPVPSQQIAPAPQPSGLSAESRPLTAIHPVVPKPQATPASLGVDLQQEKNTERRVTSNPYNPYSQSLDSRGDPRGGSGAPAANNASVPGPQVVPPELHSEPVPGSRSVPEEIKQAAPKVEPPSESRSSVVQPTTEQPVIGSVINPASLSLTSIVWHEDASKRIAVINGAIAHEGSTVEGVKVEAIYPDRVRLSREDQLFEIRIR